ncbi:hypothetical protein ANAPC5_01453 [Anaplasma phagocytophilum]|nr:hypothetical protein ANAPC5_01453 [Anaplasma phagocytophilum]
MGSALFQGNSSFGSFSERVKNLNKFRVKINTTSGAQKVIPVIRGNSFVERDNVNNLGLSDNVRLRFRAQSVCYPTGNKVVVRQLFKNYSAVNTITWCPYANVVNTSRDKICS